MSTEELNSCDLGTKEYWASAYAKELKNFEEFGDEGEIWFGEQNECRIVKWVAKNFAVSDSIVDIGCGNGHLLVRLAADHNFSCLLGLDYVEEALTLAKSLAVSKNVQGSIGHKVCDLLSSPLTILENVGTIAHAVVVDKGTYDSICLMPNMDQAKRNAYIQAVKTLITGSCNGEDQEHNARGRFLITSCNWTRDELLSHFTNDFELVEELPTPAISFGGKQGKTVTSLIFKIKAAQV
ncbi:EEF1A lysine methyltransferase 2-like isoform X2 [Varroa destructor]|nr:EEF1A lysine methyltransferase 2-like isoform X2 [Varroa destructor]XP_022670092.1 EEF1A lysine methyltransferase 2-like isoform X2 [Varroa destructor]XP_022670093.1 EEF1A lysine methyltransferase 2-like isoform X2 [Varroa destructor]